MHLIVFYSWHNKEIQEWDLSGGEKKGKKKWHRVQHSVGDTIQGDVSVYPVNVRPQLIVNTSDIPLRITQ